MNAPTFSLLFNLSLFCVFCFEGFPQKYHVFEQGGFYGLKNPDHQVVIPSRYEKLGWSNEDFSIVQDLVGFEKNQKWGLISIRNKVIKKNVYASIIPLTHGLYRASLRKYLGITRQLFYGLIDKNGTIKISFNYSKIAAIDENFLVSLWDGYSSKTGIMDIKEHIIVPIDYESIIKKNQWYFAKKNDKKWNIFLSSHRLLQDIDSFYVDDGITIIKNGKAGYFNQENQLVYNTVFKKIVKNKNEISPINFPKWMIFDKYEKILETRADTIIHIATNHWLISHNGVQSLISGNKQEKSFQDAYLKEIFGKSFITKKSYSNKWNILNQNMQVLHKDLDSIHVLSDKKYVVLIKNKLHKIYDKNYYLLFEKYLDKISSGNNDEEFIINQNGYWGVVSKTGEKILTTKYKKINRGENDHYFVSFLDKWGVVDKQENWIIQPEYDTLFVRDGIKIGQRKNSYSFYLDSKKIYTHLHHYQTLLTDELILIGNKDKLGLVTTNGHIIMPPTCDKILKFKHFIGIEKNNKAILLDNRGNKRLKEKFQSFKQDSEGYIPVKKNGLWGFLDSKGQLIISNRYEDVEVFSEGKATVKLIGKWGVINTAEKIIVQPFYDKISKFKNGTAIIRVNDQYGIIDSTANEVIKPRFKKITRLPSGNYILETTSGLKGVVNSSGIIILDASFKKIKDFNDVLFIGKGKKTYFLDYHGNEQYHIKYLENAFRINDFIYMKCFQ